MTKGLTGCSLAPSEPTPRDYCSDTAPSRKNVNTEVDKKGKCISENKDDKRKSTSLYSTYRVLRVTQ